jgi:hypothetical protein
MKAFTKFLAGGVAIAALAAAAPAAAQYYPGYGYPGYGYGYPGYGYNNGGVIGSIINGVTGGYGGYGYNVPGASQVAASQCTAAVQQRLGGYGGYGYAGGYGAGRVLGINSVEIRQEGGYRVRGVAATGGYAYGGNGTMGFSCRTDPRGFVTGVSFNNRYYGNGVNGYYGSNTYNPYAQYGYSRY